MDNWASNCCNFPNSRRDQAVLSPAFRSANALVAVDSEAGLRPSIQVSVLFGIKDRDRKLILFDFNNSSDSSAQINLVYRSYLNR